MIILPGTKNTMEDLAWMRQNGLEAAIQKLAANGKIIYGVCGGYQMLGETLSDPDGVEAGGEMKGMGLLPMDTVFAGQKTRTRVRGSFGQIGGALADLSGTALEGYEIHMGVSAMREDCGASTMTQLYNYAADGIIEGTESPAACSPANEGCGGAVAAAGQAPKLDGMQRENIYGTYVHSCFDKEGVAIAIVKAIARSKGLDMEDIAGVDYQAFKETQYDILASELRKHLDIDKIYKIMEEGIE